MPEVPKRRTVVSPQQAENLFRQAWSERFNEPVRPGVLRLLLALWDLETAGGEKQDNFNFGNQISTRPDREQFYRGIDSGNKRQFRSYPSARAGAKSFVAQVTSDTRPHWEQGLLTQDVVQFSRGLKNCQNESCSVSGPLSYYEAPFERYTATLQRRYDKYPHLQPEVGPPAPLPTPVEEPEGRGGLVLLGTVLVGLTLWVSRKKSG